MPVIPQTRLHRVYLAERWGDTLVVLPRGDAAGFSVSAVNTEMASIMTLVETGTTKHLVVDLGGGNYFGSVVLGAIIQLGNAVRAKGGRIALCGASTDMQDILRLMKLDQMWEMFADRSAALRTIATIPFKEQLWAQRRKFTWLAVIATCALLYWFLPRPHYGGDDYLIANEIWREVKSRYDLAGEDEWSRLQTKCENRLNPIIEKLEQADKRRLLLDAEPYVLSAIRDYLPSVMNRHTDPQVAESGKRMVEYFLRCAEAKLENRPLPAAVGVYPTGLTPSTTPSESSVTPKDADMQPSALSTLPEAPKPVESQKPTPEPAPATVP